MSKRYEIERVIARAAEIAARPTTLSSAKAALACVDEMLRSTLGSLRELRGIARDARQRGDETMFHRAQDGLEIVGISFTSLTRARDTVMSGIEDLTPPTTETKVLIRDLFKRLARRNRS